jgi:hypothetical protein
MSVCCNEIDKLSGLSETHLASRLGELLANDPVRGETLKTIIAATDFSHGLSPLKTCFVGSTTQNLILTCPCPVIVIRKPKGAFRKVTAA